MPVTAEPAILDLHLRIASAFLRRLHDSQLSLIAAQLLPSLIFESHLVSPLISFTPSADNFPACYNNLKLYDDGSLAIIVASKITEQTLDTLLDPATSTIIGVGIAR